MNNQTKGHLGYWFDATGQTMSAVANTKGIINDLELSFKFDLWGNVLQGTGTALISDSEEENTLEKLGNYIEATGNLVAIISMLAPVEDEVRKKLNEKGDIIETLGVSVSLPDELNEGLTLETMFDFYGHLLTIIEVKGIDEDLLDMIGEWSQAIASILALIKRTRESEV